MDREGDKSCLPMPTVAKKIAAGIGSSSSSCTDSSRFSKYSRFSYPLSIKRASLLGKFASRARNLVKSKRNRKQEKLDLSEQPSHNRNKPAETTRESDIIIKNSESRSEVVKNLQDYDCPPSPESRNETESVCESTKQVEERTEELPMPPSTYDEERSVSETSRKIIEEERQEAEDSDGESEGCIEIIIAKESVPKSTPKTMHGDKSAGKFDTNREERDLPDARNDMDSKSKRHSDRDLNEEKEEIMDEGRLEERGAVVRNETLDSHYKNIFAADTMKIRNRATVDMSGRVRHSGRGQKQRISKEKLSTIDPESDPESGFLESKEEWMFWNEEEQMIKEGKHAMIDMCGDVQQPASSKPTRASEEQPDYYKYVMKSRKKHKNFVSKLEPELNWRELYEKDKLSKKEVADSYKAVRGPKKDMMKSKRKKIELIPKNSRMKPIDARRSRSGIVDNTRPTKALEERSRSSIAGLAINAIMKLSAQSEESESSSDGESSSFSGSHDTSRSSSSCSYSGDDDDESSIGDHLMSKVLKSQDARIKLQAQEIQRLREKQKLLEIKHLQEAKRFVSKYNKAIRTIVPRENDALDDDLFSELNRATLARHFPSMNMDRENPIDNKENRKSRRKRVVIDSRNKNNPHSLEKGRKIVSSRRVRLGRSKRAEI